MTDSILLERCKDLSVDVVLLCRTIRMSQNETVMTEALMRAATNVGVLVTDARFSMGMAEYVAKMQDAVRSCLQTEYWMELMLRTGLMQEKQFHRLLNDSNTIRRMIVASMNTAK